LWQKQRERWEGPFVDGPREEKQIKESRVERGEVEPFPDVWTFAWAPLT
jgi:hypothetical protein